MPQLVQGNLWQIIARTEALKPSGDGLRVDRFAIVLDEDIACIVPEFQICDPKHIALLFPHPQKVHRLHGHLDEAHRILRLGSGLIDAILGVVQKVVADFDTVGIEVHLVPLQTGNFL